MLSRFVRMTGAERLLVERRPAWLVVVALLGVYTAAFLTFYPQGFTNTDEAQYVAHARLLVQGESFLHRLDAFTGETLVERVSDYPVGTALFIAPFVWLAGPEGAFLAPCAALIAVVLLTAGWLREEGRSPLFTLLLLGFLPIMVLGRVPLSEIPSAALVALGLWLFWRGIDRAWPWWLASGFVAGASILFREPNVLPFAPFFAGTVLRRETKCWALIAGGLAGIGIRMLGAYLAFGDPFFVKKGYVFDSDTIMDRVPYYAFGLLVLLPGGLAAGLLYRGRRWPELVATASLFTLFYLTQTHTTSPSGPARAVVIALRYFIPLIPVLVFAMAEVVPRVWHGACERSTPERRAFLERLAAAALAVSIAGIALGSVGMHWLLHRWSASQAEIREAIHEHISDDAVLVTNWHATRKFLRRIEGRFKPVWTLEVSPEDVVRLVDRHGQVYIALLDRSDSEYWRDEAVKDDAFVDAVALPKVLELDRQMTPTDRLKIWRVGREAM